MLALRNRAQYVPALLLAIGLLLSAPGSHAEITRPTSHQALTDNEIEPALEAVRHDANVHSERTQRILRWQSTPKSKEAKTPSSWSQGWSDAFAWLVDLLEWLAESSRMLMWLLIAALAGALIVLVLRITRYVRATADTTPRHAVPTHIQNIDIRPESLPEDIGQAAMQLWQQGAQREALALLYRATLSRLVNVHGVPIKASSTEEDCLRLSAPLLDTARLAYTRQLISSWQRASYGGVLTDEATVRQLCEQFAARLDVVREAMRP